MILDLTEDEIEKFRALIELVLRGLIPLWDHNTWTFDGGGLQNAVVCMEALDPEWLTQLVRDRRFELTRRRLVARYMRDDAIWKEQEREEEQEREK